MSSPFERARRELPNLPEEVFRLWLDERIQALGWPPEGSAWEGALFGRSLEFLKTLKWTREMVRLAPEDLGPKSLEAAIVVLEANLPGGREAMHAPEAQERFDWTCELIGSTATLPAPLVLISTGDGYEVAEGTQTLAAMMLLAARHKKVGFYPGTVEAWIGAIRAG